VQIADSEHGGQEVRTNQDENNQLISIDREQIVDMPLNQSGSVQTLTVP
jgi:hypothetical protein